MAYTFSVKTKASPSNFGGLAVDGNRVSMTGAIGSGIQTQDDTATPVKSPVSVTTAAITTLNIPSNAAQIVIHSTTTGASNALNISEVSDLASYTQINNGDGPVYFDVARQSKIYLQGVGTTITTAFHFVIV